MGDRRLLGVSFIRGLAITGVVLVHMPHFFPGISTHIEDIFSFGQMGCQAFFVLSGYCLCMSATSNDNIQIGKFYKRRFASIAPGYWLTIAINILLCLMTTLLFGIKFLPTFDGNIVHVLINVLLLNGFVPLEGPMNCVVLGGWFVGTIVIMYLLFPLLFKIYSYDSVMWKRIRRVVFPLLISVCCCGLMFFSGYGQDSYCLLSSVKYFSIVNQLPCFVIGFSLCDRQLFEESRTVLFTKFFVMLVSTLILFYGHFSFSYIIAPIMASLSVVYLYALIERMDNEGVFIRFIMKLGDKSFSIYLSHFWIAYGLIPFFFSISGLQCVMNGNILYLISLPILLVLSYYIAMFYDRLISRIKL